MPDHLISEHIFLFPFMWETPQKGEMYLLDNHKHIKKCIFTRFKNWEVEYLNIQEDKDYNEFVYFYKHVRSVIYTYEQAPIITLNYTNKWIKSDSVCEIGINDKHYCLEIAGLRLKLYKTGVGILSIHLRNRHYGEIEDIVHINSLSKSIYPPILPIEKAREDYFPDYIKLILDKEHSLEENFKEAYKKKATHVAPFIMDLLGEPFINKAQKPIKKPIKGIQKAYICIEPIIGSHMFTLCLYRNKWMLDQIKNKHMSIEDLDRFTLLSNKVKTELKEGNLEHMGIEYIHAHESIYTISRYALICVSSESVDSKIYDQLITLILAQRATLLNFSNQLALISTLPKQALVPAIQNAYEIYIQFINQMYFEEVTEAIQGELIYEKLSAKFKIKKELHQLDFEMEEIHEYASLVEQSLSKFKMDFLTIVGASLVIPTFVTGFFGMGILQHTFNDWWHHKEALLWINGYVLFPILALIMFYTWSRKFNRRSLFERFILLILTLASLGVLIGYGCGLSPSV